MVANGLNTKKSLSNEVYKEDQMKSIWLEYGHEADLPEIQVSAKEVK
jgi:hypothetical protein